MYNYRVCFADTDSGGIVYHGRYFEMAERARNTLMREIGIDTTKLFRGRTGYALVVRNVTAQFVTPALVDDLLEITSFVIKHSLAQTRWRTEIRRDDIMICSMDADLVCLDLETKKPCFLPDFLDKPLSTLQKESEEKKFIARIQS